MLTPWEKSAAARDGGKPIANRKAHIARVKTALVEILNRGEKMGDCADVLTEAQREILRNAVSILAGLEHQEEKDLRDARRIKAAHDAAEKAASSALRGLVKDKIADAIALYAIAHPQERSELSDLRREISAKPASWTWRLSELVRDAIAELTYRIVSKKADPAAWCAAIAHDLAAARDTHSGLIQQIKAAAVQAELAKAVAKP